MKDKPTVYKRDSAFIDTNNKGDFVEVTEWYNKEGYTIQVTDNTSLGTRTIDVTSTEFDAIKQCIKTLNKL